jgi:flagellar hook-associated protein 2
MGITPLAFVGISKFSNDFQTILNRAVQIAELPVRQLQNRDADVLQKKTLFSGLSAGVAGLASSLKSLGETAANRALSASSSNPDAVAMLYSGATTPATYVIDEITSVAAAASERTLIGYADSAATPVGSTGDFKLVVGDDEFVFTPAGNTLVGLRDHINALGAGVTASILTTADGNYLSLSANASGATTLALYDDPGGANTNLLTAANQGSDAVFKLNGITVTQTTNLVNSVIPGLTFTIRQATAAPVTLALSSSRAALASALESFVAQYNNLRALVNAQVGPAAGLLSGNFVVHQLQTLLRGIASYRTSGETVNSLAELGVEFDSAGKAALNAGVFNRLTDAQLDGAFKFLGSAGVGLGAFSGRLAEFSDPIRGLIRMEQESLDRIDKQLQTQIEQMTARIEAMRKGLARKLQQADTLLAALESQQTQLEASLEGLSLVLYGRKDR